MHFTITGISRGLGRSLVDELIATGHTISGCARDVSSVDALTKRYGSHGHAFAAVDVSDDLAVKRWAGDVIDRLGPPERLINNAAIINRNDALWKLTAEEFSCIFDVNVKGTFHVIQAFLPAMIEAGRGIVVNFSSGWGRVPAAEVAAYCGTKWAIEGLTQSLALDLPAGLAAIPVNPGIINTDMLQSCFGGGASRFPDAATWAKQAAPFLVNLTSSQNGHPLSI